MKCWLFFICLTPLFLFAQTKTTDLETEPLVKKIMIRRHPLFSEPAERSNPLYSFVNFLHPLTKENIIRRELLISEGDSLKVDLIEESMRNLRKLGFIGDISVEIDTLSPSTVSLTFDTFDKSTKSIRTNFSSTGGLNKAELGFRDSNLMGLGTKVFVNYDYRSDRTHPHGTKFQYDNKRLFNSYWRSLLQYKDAEELNIRTLLFERKFYADNARWAASFYGDKGSLIEKTYENGLLAKEQPLSTQNVSSWISKSWGEERKIRPIFFYYYNRIKTDGPRLRSFENVDFWGTGINIQSRKFKTVHAIDLLDRIEDQAIGYSASIFMAQNLNSLSATDYYTQFKLTTAFFAKDKVYSALDISFIRYWVNNVISDQTLEITTSCYKKMPLSQTLGFRVSLLTSKNWSEGRQVVLGGVSGIRGYSAFNFSGQNRFLGNFENRLSPDLTWWILRLGFVVFFDTGMVWDSYQNVYNQRLLGSVGLGFRIANKKSGSDNLTRVDFAFKLNENKFGSISISSSHLFNFIMPIDFSPPALRHP